MMRPTAQMDALPRKPGHIVVRGRFYAWRLNYRVLLLAALGLVGIVVLTTWAMTLGSVHIPFGDVARAVVGRASEKQEFVVRELRLPRVLCAILIGAMLAMSGAIFQGLVRNPLVSPDIIGIDAGASLAAVLWIVNGLPAATVPIVALAGAGIAAMMVYLLSWKGGIAPERLVLVGIGIGAAMTALTTLLLVRSPVQLARPAEVWTMGSVYGSSWHDVRWLVATLLIAGIAAIVLMWPLRVLQLGDDVTRGLGISLERTRLSLIVTGCALAAVAVATAGPVAFVALIVPHVARMLAGPLSGSVLVLTGVAGAIFLLAADMIAQHALPVTLPVGVVTAAVGAPYFLFLLYRSSVRL